MPNMRTMNAQDLTVEQLAQAVAEMGAAGRTQQEIAEALGSTLSIIRYRLANAGYVITSETRVKLAHTGEDVRDRAACAA